MQFGQHQKDDSNAKSELIIQILSGTAVAVALGAISWLAFAIAPRTKVSEDKIVRLDEKLTKLEGNILELQEATKPASSTSDPSVKIDSRTNNFIIDRIRQEVETQLAQKRPAGGDTGAPRPVAAKLEVPVGTVMAYAGEVTDGSGQSTLPAEWMVCDGRPLSSGEYKPLYETIGLLYGDGTRDSAGNRVDRALKTDFNLPDYRGMFLRGVTGERKDEYADLDIYARTSPPTARSGTSKVGTLQTDATRGHDHAKPGMAIVMLRKTGEDGWRIKTDPKGGEGPFVAVDALPTFGGADNRPRNQYVYFIIKVK